MTETTLQKARRTVTTQELKSSKARGAFEFGFLAGYAAEVYMPYGGKITTKAYRTGYEFGQLRARLDWSRK